MAVDAAAAGVDGVRRGFIEGGNRIARCESRLMMMIGIVERGG